jgi:hypothetical protein
VTDRLQQFTRRVDRCSRALELTGPDADRFARTAGPVLKGEILTAATAAFGSDRRPWKNKSVTANTGYDVEPAQSGRGVRLSFKLRPAGVWVFGEQGAAEHLIGGGRNYKRGASYRAKSKKAPKSNRTYVAAAGYRHPVQAPVLHPGTPGKKAIRYAFKRFRQAQGAAAQAGIVAVVRDAVR